MYIWFPVNAHVTISACTAEEVIFNPVFTQALSLIFFAKGVGSFLQIDMHTQLEDLCTCTATCSSQEHQYTWSLLVHQGQYCLSDWQWFCKASNLSYHLKPEPLWWRCQGTKLTVMWTCLHGYEPFQSLNTLSFLLKKHLSIYVYAPSNVTSSFILLSFSHSTHKPIHLKKLSGNITFSPLLRYSPLFILSSSEPLDYLFIFCFFYSALPPNIGCQIG